MAAVRAALERACHLLPGSLGCEPTGARVVLGPTSNWLPRCWNITSIYRYGGMGPISICIVLMG